MVMYELYLQQLINSFEIFLGSQDEDLRIPLCVPCYIHQLPPDMDQKSVWKLNTNGWLTRFHSSLNRLSLFQLMVESCDCLYAPCRHKKHHIKCLTPEMQCCRDGTSWQSLKTFKWKELHIHKQRVNYWETWNILTYYIHGSGYYRNVNRTIFFY